MKERRPKVRFSGKAQALEATVAAHIIIPKKLPEEHPFYSMVGRVASEWSHLEHWLDVAIWELAGVRPKKGACITSQIMGVGPRCRVIIMLCTVVGLSESLKVGYKALLNDSYAVAELRARVVHDPWFTSERSDDAAQFRAMPWADKHYGLRTITQEDIEKTIVKIRCLCDRAKDLRISVRDELRASSKKSA
jgi:hypothetical protein